MSGPSSSSPPEGSNPNLQGAADDTKPRLTEEEKKQNHIASEQKRREAIRAGFDRLCDLVPGLEGQGRSEGLVLKKTVEYMKEQLEQRRDIILRLEADGRVVEDKYKEALNSLKILEDKQNAVKKDVGGQYYPLGIDQTGPGQGPGSNAGNTGFGTRDDSF
ncbi:hypothetical protein MGN70_006577 [Eutypa lata]|uniref:Putative helix-loop-helix dna-binding domain-containing protein n=1 Tax=Eutypa lata (strain UCR-EL1) TaxID=1287681 RepID=M7T1W7_EUTLA|nr:putative helix-loop-helix dna-binding domain-containing protein [Eutypa lata UCREL1]KAI1252005.1 hypothetical protein MGN70_006577 [Eutypa lata]